MRLIPVLNCHCILDSLMINESVEYFWRVIIVKNHYSSPIEFYLKYALKGCCLTILGRTLKSVTKRWLCKMLYKLLLMLYLFCLLFDVFANISVITNVMCNDFNYIILT